MKIKSKKIICILLAIIILWGIFFTTDLIRTNKNMKPIFAINISSYDDGGSKKYVGLFYNVYSLHYYNPNMNEDWINDDGTIKDEYKDKEFIVFKKLVPWFVSIDKVKDDYDG